MDRILSTSPVKQMKKKRFVKSCILMATAFGNQTAVAAEADNACVNEFLKVQGSLPKTIMPGQTALVSLVSSSGRKEAEIKLSARNVNKLLVVSGEIRNVGACNISMFMPIKLHPIRNGLPLGWHSLPEGINNSSRLQAGSWQTFNKQYSKDYLGGLNLALGSWSLEASPKQEEAKKEEPAPEQVEAKPSTPLSEAEKLFAEALENDDLTEANQRLNDAFAKAQRENAAHESFRNTMQQSIQMMQTLQAQQILLEQQKIQQQLQTQRLREQQLQAHRLQEQKLREQQLQAQKIREQQLQTQPAHPETQPVSPVKLDKCKSLEGSHPSILKFWGCKIN